MSQHLVLTIRIHDQRYHGTSDWPPAPARVFQALVAGVARGNALPGEVVPAFEWMESLPPPIIAAPRVRVGSRVELFVPNNDSDSVDGDPARIGEIRTKKLVLPLLFEEAEPLIYAWPLPADTKHVSTVLEAANNLYQLGRGVDMAWAVGELVDDAGLSLRLADHRGTVHRPGGTDGDNPLPCPASGSLESLMRRHRASTAKLRAEGVGNAARILFSQPPKPRFMSVGYDSSGHRSVYELRDRNDDTKLWAWPLERVVLLTERLRDAAAARLRSAFPDQVDAIERTLIGRKADGRDAAPGAHRVRIVPLPSIGHEHVDCAVRRVVVEVPVDCPLRGTDVHWAFSGLEPMNQVTGEVSPFILAQSNDHRMLGHYRPKNGTRRWRSVTAVALPMEAMRRRIEPSRWSEVPKGASERAGEESRAADAVRTAMRHGGVRASAVEVKVQREPFETRGARAESFADGTRFPKERLWHVELESSELVEGLFLIGDGRFLGLGLMAPVRETRSIFGFTIGVDPARVDGDALVRAMRRAVMSRVQTVLGAQPLGRFFSGHEENGDPAQSEQASHFAVQWDPVRGRLLIIPPHALDHRPPTWDERHNLDVLRRAMDGFIELRAGHAGRYQLSRCVVNETDEYLGPSKSWSSVRPYTVTRHRKGVSAATVLTEDVIAECARRGLPRPMVKVLDFRGVPGRGLEGKLRLDFEVAINGPMVLGRTRYLGGGLFAHLMPR